MPIRPVVLVLAMAAAPSAALATGTPSLDPWRTFPPDPKLIAAAQTLLSENCRLEMVRVWSDYPRRFEWRRIEVCWPRSDAIH